MAGRPSFDAAFEQLGHAVPEGSNDTGNPNTDHSALIREAASEAVRNEQGSFIEPGTQFHEGRPTPREEPTPEVDEHGLEVSPEPEAQPQQQQTQQPQPPTDSGVRLPPPDFERLNQMFGINTPEEFESAPPAVQDAYSVMAQHLEDAHNAQQRALQEAQTADLRIKSFTERLKDPQGQRRLILSMASEAPEVFQEALQVVERMQEDPAYRDAVSAQIRAEVELEATKRAQQAAQASQQLSRGQQVESRVSRLAERLGVDPQKASDRVVERILANQARTGQPDITFEEVDEIVSSMAVPRQPQQVRSPQAQKQQQRAPQQAASEAGKQPAPAASRPQPNASPRGGAEGQNPMDALRSAVKQSSERVRNLGL